MLIIISDVAERNALKCSAMLEMVCLFQDNPNDWSKKDTGPTYSSKALESVTLVVLTRHDNCFI